MSTMIKERIPLIDPNLSTKDKIKYIIYFVLRAFFIASLILILGIFLLFIIYFGDLFSNVNSGKYKYPLYGIYVIVSPSMVPTIRVNDGVFIKRNDNFKIGDIITFESTNVNINMPITHRIVSIEEMDNGSFVYRTKGDNNGFIDKDVVSHDNIMGKVMIKFPKLGVVKSFLRNYINMLLVGIIFITLILYGCSIRLKRINYNVE